MPDEKEPKSDSTATEEQASQKSYDEVWHKKKEPGYGFCLATVIAIVIGVIVGQAIVQGLASAGYVISIKILWITLPIWCVTPIVIVIAVVLAIGVLSLFL